MIEDILKESFIDEYSMTDLLEDDELDYLDNIENLPKEQKEAIFEEIDKEVSSSINDDLILEKNESK